MSGWRRYLELKVQAKTGLSSGIFVWAGLAVVCAIVAFVFILVTAFVWLSARYQPLIAALAYWRVSSCSVRFAALVCCLWSCAAGRLNMQSWPWQCAETRLCSNPRLLAGAIQVSRAFGWRKVIPVIAVGVLAAGIGMQWFGRDKVNAESDEEERAREEEEAGASGLGGAATANVGSRRGISRSERKRRNRVRLEQLPSQMKRNTDEEEHAHE